MLIRGRPTWSMLADGRKAKAAQLLSRVLINDIAFLLRKTRRKREIEFA